MGVIRKLAVRNMKRRKTRYILTTVTLIIGVSLFGGVLIANDSFQVTFVNDLDRRMGTADILLRNTEHEDGWFDADDLEEVEKIANEGKEKLIKVGIPEENITFKVQVQDRGIARDILAELEGGGYGILVLGRKGFKSINQFGLGSKANKLLLTAHALAVCLVN